MLMLPQLKIRPIFPGLDSHPLILDLSTEGNFLKDLEPGDQIAFQKKMEGLMEGRHEWGLSFYLENRKSLLSTCPQMVEEERFYHLGLDIIVKAGTTLHSPLEGKVIDAGFEEGRGNYGGYILLEYRSPEYEVFYTLFGHLDPGSLKPPGSLVQAGDPLALTGTYEKNGNWFDHTHMQILTEQGYRKGFQYKGYCQSRDLEVMDQLCPSPVPLFLLSKNGDN